MIAVAGGMAVPDADSPDKTVALARCDSAAFAVAPALLLEGSLPPPPPQPVRAKLPALAKRPARNLRRVARVSSWRSATGPRIAGTELFTANAALLFAFASLAALLIVLLRDLPNGAKYMGRKGEIFTVLINHMKKRKDGWRGRCRENTYFSEKIACLMIFNYRLILFNKAILVRLFDLRCVRRKWRKENFP
jgi:hypothetical protein